MKGKADSISCTYLFIFFTHGRQVRIFFLSFRRTIHILILLTYLRHGRAQSDGIIINSIRSGTVTEHQKLTHYWRERAHEKKRELYIHTVWCTYG